MDEEKSTHNPETLDFLAWELVQNHISVSLSEGEINVQSEALEHILDEEKINKNEFASFKKEVGWKRNILVLGAGATFNSYSCIPLADTAVKEIQKNLGFPEKVIFDLKKVKEWPFEEPKRGRKITRVKNKHILLRKDFKLRDNNIDFETYLHLLTRYYSTGTVRNELSNLYGKDIDERDRRFLPCLFYDIVAHLLKHSFLDAIINFNFDELLDQAIEEEIGKGHYHFVFSDGHVQDLGELAIGKRLKKPLYIKPHGTVSHKSSMRFTKDQYFDIPQGIKNLLEQLLRGDPQSQSNRKRPINLIVIGFNMKSLEFNEVLMNCLPKDSNIVYINYDSEPKTGLKKLDKSNYGNINKHFFFDLKRYKKGLNSLDNCLIELWTNIENLFKTEFKPRGIDNHQIIHTIFYEKKYANKKTKVDAMEDFGNAAYFKKRMKAELLLTLYSKGKFVELTEILKGKAGLYFEQYIKKTDKSTAKKKDQLFPLLEELGYTNHINRNLLAYKPGDSKEMPDEDLTKKLLDLAPITTNEQSIRESLENLSRPFSYEILPNFRDRQHLVFKTLDRDNILSTNLALTYRFMETFREGKWNTLLLVSESGSVLMDTDGKLRDQYTKALEFINRKNKIDRTINILVTNLDKEKVESLEALETDFKSHREPLKLRMKIDGILDIYNHNHHMAVFLSEKKPKDDSGKEIESVKIKHEDKDHFVCRSIYFYKRALDHTINPFYLDGGISSQEAKRYESQKEKFLDLRTQDHQRIVDEFSNMKKKSQKKPLRS